MGGGVAGSARARIFFYVFGVILIGLLDRNIIKELFRASIKRVSDDNTPPALASTVWERTTELAWPSVSFSSSLVSKRGRRHGVSSR